MRTFFSFEKELWRRTQSADLSLCRFERFLDKPVVKRGPKGSPDRHMVSWFTILREKNEFKMWYMGMRPPNEDDWWHQEDRHSLCIAKSADGIVWEKPDLKLKDVPCGGAPNNVLPVSSNFCGCTVLKEDDGYVMSYSFPYGRNIRTAITTFTIFKSRDGLR